LVSKGTWEQEVDGQKHKNARGLFDMLGNVEQWVADWFDLYPTSGLSITDARGPTEGV
jgi:formylglycine-generating enzyme required for sulfatase activity